MKIILNDKEMRNKMIVYTCLIVLIVLVYYFIVIFVK